jgi:hypothetical protein
LLRNRYQLAAEHGLPRTRLRRHPLRLTIFW